MSSTRALDIYTRQLMKFQDALPEAVRFDFEMAVERLTTVFEGEISAVARASAEWARVSIAIERIERTKNKPEPEFVDEIS